MPEVDRPRSSVDCSQNPREQTQGTDLLSLESSQSIFRNPSLKWRVLLAIAGIVCFLAPLNILSGMMAKHGDHWKLLFLGSFLLWLVLLVLSLVIDLLDPSLPSPLRRCLWHVGSCVVAFYFFVSILHIDSDNLPQWIPAIVDSGIGVSFGLQNIPIDARERLWQHSLSILTSTCGAAQITVHQSSDPLLPQVQPTTRPTSMELRSTTPTS